MENLTAFDHFTFICQGKHDGIIYPVTYKSILKKLEDLVRGRKILKIGISIHYVEVKR